MPGVKEDGGEGYTIPLSITTDKASVQEANRSISSFEENLKSLASVDLGQIGDGLKDLGKFALAAGAVGVASLKSQTEGLLQSLRAGLSTDEIIRWQSVAKQLAISPDAVIKNITTVYQEMASLMAKGKVDKDKLTSMGLSGTDIEKFINSKSNSSRISLVIDNALKSKMPVDQMTSLLSDFLGPALADVFLMLKATGGSFSEEYNKAANYNTEGGRQKAADFNSEFEALKTGVKSVIDEFIANLSVFFIKPLDTANAYLRDNGDKIRDLITPGGDPVINERKKKLEEAYNRIKPAGLLDPNKDLKAGLIQDAQFDELVYKATKAVVFDEKLYNKLLSSLQQAGIGSYMKLMTGKEKSEYSYKGEDVPDVDFLINKKLGDTLLIDRSSEQQIRDVIEEVMKANSKFNDREYMSPSGHSSIINHFNFNIEGTLNQQEARELANEVGNAVDARFRNGLAYLQMG